MSDAYDFYEKFYDMAENLRSKIEDAILPSVKEETDMLRKEKTKYEKENSELEHDLCILQNRIQEAESRKVTTPMVNAASAMADSRHASDIPTANASILVAIANPHNVL